MLSVACPPFVRQPVLDRRRQFVGYELGCSSPRELLPALRQTSDAGEGPVCFVPIEADSLGEPALRRLDTRRTVLMLDGRWPDDPGTVDGITDLRRTGFRFGIGDAAPHTGQLTHLPRAHFARFDAERTPPGHAERFRARIRLPGLRLVASKLQQRQQFEASLRDGFDCFAGHHFAKPERFGEKPLAPVYGIVLKAMNLAREEAPLQRIDATLRADAALGFRLLRYINAAGNARSRQIRTLHEAMQMLGYRPLARWLGLTLVTARVDAGAGTALARTAATRGRLMELLGTERLNKVDGDALFLTGLFSLMHAMLDLPMPQVVERLGLDGPVAAALVSGEGPLGPWLRLAQACEADTPTALSAACEAVDLPLASVGPAHLEALRWVDTLGL